MVEVAVKKKKRKCFILDFQIKLILCEIDSDWFFVDKKSKTIEDHEFKLLNDFFCKTDNQPKEEINLVKSSSKK